MDLVEGGHAGSVYGDQSRGKLGAGVIPYAQVEEDFCTKTRGGPYVVQTACRVDLRQKSMFLAS